MCFSAEVSFTAAGVLAVIGLGLLSMKKPPRLQYICMIPLLFALQQASEGALWLLLPEGSNSFLSSFFQYTFLFFAFIIWPIWVPLALLRAENIMWRKVLLWIPFLVGIALAAFDISLLFTNQIVVKIIGHSISYDLAKEISINLWYLKILYVLVIVAPCFISSLKRIKTYGTLIILSWLVTALFFLTTFTSVWCFFAALLSIYLIFVVRANREEIA